MTGSWWEYLIYALLAICFQGFFTMMEMAFVSFNRVRLAYFVSRGSRRAIRLNRLLRSPSYLFGTTLIGVNFFLQIGSEFSRLFYMSLGLDAGYAIISQIFLVVIFAELAPMFAARSYSEHVAMLGITPIYILSKILIPIIWFFNGICAVIDWISRSPPTPNHYLTREELQKAIETKDQRRATPKEEEFSTLIQNIFSLKAKTPVDLMRPIEAVQSMSYEAKSDEVRRHLMENYTDFLPLCYEDSPNIFGVIYTRDLYRLKPNSYVREVARSPWFITEKNSLLQILKQFRWNNQRVAIVLDQSGIAIGVLTLDDLIDGIFHSVSYDEIRDLRIAHVIVNRSFPADTLVSAVNQKLGISLPSETSETLEDLMQRLLGHSPQKTEYVRIAGFELILEETPLLTDKTVRITSH